VTEAKLEAVIKAVTTAARTGKIGDGKIFVYEVIEAIRIRTTIVAKRQCKGGRRWDFRIWQPAFGNCGCSPWVGQKSVPYPMKAWGDTCDYTHAASAVN